MRYNRLDLNLLVALKALLLEKNVTRAGESLHMTQSAMSGVLARLREFFDDPLLVQVGRKTELSPLAESLIEPISEVILRIDAALATRPMFEPAHTRRHFSFVASDYVQNVLMFDVLAEVHREAPGLTVELRQPSMNSAMELEAGEVDFVINHELFASQHHSGEVLFEDTYTVVAARENDCFGDEISLDDYLAAGHVVFQNGSRNLPMFEIWFARQHRRARRVEVAGHTFNLLPHMVLGTQRLATMHTRLARHYVDILPIRLIKPLFETPRLVEVLQWHSSRDSDAATVWLRDMIIAAARRLPPV
ncbi:LysR family transcriptional regulator [Paraburkholderia tropica]|uniref:LysR family transcriptional regulator n=1 Tax=Paraburkholderia tropica TaxID=92647 RepID=UPI002AAF1912|nr:LysR family transcriptional regulator [Paraburkholderia tropica]